MSAPAALVLGLVASGCGRLDFAALGDASGDGMHGTIGHDEDGDGVPDTLDVCPHVVDDQSDGDGDGVGDACDWEPTIPRQHLQLFATMEASDQPFMLDHGVGTWTQLADAVHFDGNGAGSIEYPIPLQDARVIIGMTVVTIFGSGQHQLAMTLDNPNSNHDFVEFNEIPASFSSAQVTHFDGSTYTRAQGIPLPSGIHAGAVTLQETAVVNTSVTLDGGWAGEPYHVSEPTTLYQGGVGILFDVLSMAIDVRYVCIITAS